MPSFKLADVGLIDDLNSEGKFLLRDAVPHPQSL